MKNFGNKHYFTRSETRSMSTEHPIGDPFGGAAYGELNDPVTATAVGIGGSVVGGVLGGRSAEKAARTQANAQLEAARIAAEAARFTPVGVTGRYGSSNFGFDESGRLNSAGYNLSPEALAQQNQLAEYAQRGLDQYGQSFDQSQALGQAGQGMMNLGQQYLGTSPQAQAQNYYQQQQGLVAGNRERALADVRNNAFQTGRSGLMVGGTTSGDLATNPELAAYYNAIAQEDRQMAAQATQGGMDYAKFGQGMMTAGAGAYDQMYNMQNAAFSPYQTAQGGVAGLEAQGQNMLNMGAELGGRTAGAGAVQGQLLNQGGQAAANSRFQADAYNPWASALQGAGNMGMMYAMNQPRSAAVVPYSAANNASAMFTV